MDGPLQQAMFQSFTCTRPWKAIVDMSKDGPMNIDGAEEAKKMIKRHVTDNSWVFAVIRHFFAYNLRDGHVSI